MPPEDLTIKQALLDAATRLFIERGFDTVSVRDIANEAGVTHGSIRYHFETKENLYLAALTRVSTAGDEVEGHVVGEPPAELLTPTEGERQLRAAVKQLVAFQAKVGADRHAAEGLLRAEISRDGGPHPAFFERVIKPGHERLKWIIRSIRPDITDDKTLEILTFNVIFQCVMVRIGQGVIRELLGTTKLKKNDVNLIGDLIVAVTLDGLRHIEV
ncbi:MAG: CerR family C-terminal domain-containing protein [Planctomycetota bacterium]